MTQSQQQQQERKFIAVDFRGIQQASRARSALALFGSVGLEVFASLATSPPVPAEIDDGADTRPPLGAAGDLVLGLGGEAARAAYAYARLGGLVRLHGTVGKDAAGDLIARWLADAGVEAGGLRRVEHTPMRVLVAAAGYQTVTIRQSGPSATAADRVPARVGTPLSTRSTTSESPHSRGRDPEAMGARVPDVPEVDAEALGERGQTLLLADYPDAGGWRGEAAASLLRRARERGVRTVVSLAPVVLGASGAPLTPADLEPLLPHVDLVCGGQPELRRATRRTDPQEAARALIGGGARAVLAKRGPDGAAVFRPGPAALEREDAATPATASRLPGGQALDPLRRAAAFGAVFDAAYLLGLALNDSSPIRFAAAAAARAALSPHGVLGM